MIGPDGHVAEPRILILGYQGFANLGDEAILTGIETILKGRHVRVVGIVCGPEPASVAAFPGAPRISSLRLLPSLASMRALWGSDALVLGGGGLIHDHWSIVIPRYLGWIALARLFGKRVVWLGVGVGPIRRRLHAILARMAARLTTLALVRDRRSAELIGGESSRVAIIPDPAYFNQPPGPDVRRRDNELAIVVRGPTPGEAQHADALAAGLVEAFRLARGRGWQPVLMTMAGPADEQFASRVQRRLSAVGMSGAIEALGPTPRHVIDRLGQVGGAITVRLHALLLASLAATPCVAVAYDPKVSFAADELGIADLVVTPLEFRPEALMDRLDEARVEARMALVADRIAAIRKRMPDVADQVVAAIEGIR